MTKSFTTRTNHSRWDYEAQQGQEGLALAAKIIAVKNWRDLLNQKRLIMFVVLVQKVFLQWVATLNWITIP